MTGDRNTLDLLTRLLRSCVLNQDESPEIALADLLYDLGCNKTVEELIEEMGKSRSRMSYHPHFNLTEEQARLWAEHHPQEHVLVEDWVKLLEFEKHPPHWAGYLTTSLHRCRLLACWLCGLDVPSDWAARMITSEITGDLVKLPPVLIV